MINLEDETQGSVWGFSPLFITVVIYAAIIRLLDIYIIVTSLLVGYLQFWLDPVIGFLSFGDIILTTALLFFGLSIYELKGKFRSLARWLTMMTTLLLVLYIVFLCLNVRSFINS
jgi:hypothetical protein